MYRYGYTTTLHNIYIYINEKILFSCEINQNVFFYQNSALQAACDTSIASVTGCVYPREGYKSVIPMLMPGSTGLVRRSASSCARSI